MCATATQMRTPTEEDARGLDYIEADYSRPHPLPRYAGLHLVNALRYPTDEASIRAAINYIPHFTDEMRRAERPLRRLMLKEMKRFRVVLPRTLQLAADLHGSKLESYVDRVPHSVAVVRRLRELRKHAENGTFPEIPKNGAQFAGALFSVPGYGKTTGIDAVTSLYKDCKLIFHRDLGIWQIPIIQLSMALLGSTKKSLALNLIHEISRAFPIGDYQRLYLKTRLNANQLLLQAFALLQIHAVGHVIVDEGQGDFQEAAEDLDRDPSDQKTPLSSLLIAGSNQSRVPVFMVGTHELKQSFGKRLTLRRRSTGIPWGPLSSKVHSGQMSEFDLFFELLWTCQILDVFTPHTERLRRLFHFYTYGSPDTLVQLFTRVQEHALDFNLPSITEELVTYVARTYLADLTDVAIALHAKDHPGAKNFLFQISDVRTAYFPNSGPKEFTRTKEALSWKPEVEVGQFLESLDAKPGSRRRSKPQQADDDTGASESEPSDAAGKE